MAVFGIGGPELVLILIVLLIFVGPDKLPAVAKSVGTGIRDLRRAANVATAEIREGMEELSREVDSVQRDVESVAASASQPSSAQPVAEVARRRTGQPAAEAGSMASGEGGDTASTEADGAPQQAPNSPVVPRFNRPTGAPLPGTVAQGGATQAGPTMAGPTLAGPVQASLAPPSMAEGNDAAAEPGSSPHVASGDPAA